ncbi:MAG: MaoC family dehydratase [Actinomycetales bacterium]|nr:MaoC family dehydratase [Tetrasphaera sp.]NLW99139.1 MaoC family dehydratase [Actinomycetales bacterium]
MKTNPGNYFEDFHVGQELVHSSPRTVTAGDAALYTALYGSRFALTSGASTAARMGMDRMPLDALVVFHTVFGKTVPEVSLNAVANLGYASCRFTAPVFAGDTLSARSEVIGVKANRDGKTGVVYVHSTGTNQDGVVVLDYVRWVMVRKRNEESPAPETVIPDLPGAVAPDDLVVPAGLSGEGYDTDLGGSPYLWDDYEVGERVDHVDGMTIEEAEHMTATRLWHNTAKVHFNQHVEGQGRFGRRIVYGGHVISIARSLSFNGLANAVTIAAINGGTHSNPTFAGDTVYAWSEVLDRMELPGRTDLGALRVRTVATKDLACADFPYRGEDGKYLPQVVLDLDYTVLMPRR